MFRAALSIISSHHQSGWSCDFRGDQRAIPTAICVLRGSSHGPNYDAASVAQALADLKASMLPNASAWSDHRYGARQLRQERGARGRSGRRNRRTRRGRRTGILGIMMETSSGRAIKPAPLDQLEYGKSITDACVPWDRTEQLLHTLADVVDARSQAADVSAPSLLSLGKEATRRADHAAAAEHA